MNLKKDKEVIMNNKVKITDVDWNFVYNQVSSRKDYFTNEIKNLIHKESH